ncbi:Gfo/Idh/MocA family protein [Bombella mellum]|uniref:Glucose-fructose oxidoreductase n=1 Tax=Bombella mellum TaxID=2039288 RepID=A0ABR5ZRL2_9PROT|nr:Gfo/Idh/MocA family oxidoreductase [Bombella mellum]MBA5726962.1 glucose-fructose oxidoreductase [Bombella mellum]
MSSHSPSHKPVNAGRRHVLGALGASILAGGAGKAVAQSLGFPAPPAGLGQRPYPNLLRPLNDGPRKFGYAIVGLGKYAVNQILPAFAECEYAKVTALVSGDLDKARRLGQHYGIDESHLYTYDNFDKIAQDPEVDAVYIILPNSLHADFTERAFRAGKHVLCEKPMAVTVEECQRMIAAGKKAGKKLMIGYRCHFDPVTQKAIELARSSIGKPQIITTDNGDNTDPTDPTYQWRLTRSLSGGGALMDLGIYGVNGSRYMLNEDPIEVQATIMPPSDPMFREIDETIVWIMKYRSGAVAHGSASFNVNAMSRFNLQGTDASLRMDPATSYWCNSVSHCTSGDTHTWSTPMFTIPALNQFSAQLDHLAISVANNTPLAATGEEGMQDVRLIQAMYQSANSGSRPVSTDWGDWRKTI